MILQGLKPCIFKRLEKFKARWVAELPSVLWSLRTTPTCGTSYTPFFMVHGLEAVLLTDIDYGSPRVHRRRKPSIPQRRYRPTRRGSRRGTTTLRPGTNKRCGITIAAPSEKGLSKSGTWCCTGSRATRITTSYRRHGKAPSSSIKSYVPVPTSLKMQTADPSPTLRTSNSYVVTTLKKYLFPVGRIA
jgi:hypothetical protein